MRALLNLLRDLSDRFSRATAFANTDNLGDALRLMEERHSAEVEQRRSDLARCASLRTMNRPRPSRQARNGSVERGASRCAASSKILAVN